MSYERVLTALAEPTRRRLFEDVVQRPRAVGELADRAGVSQPAVSQHLKTLREAGLVQVEVAGTRRIYHASPAGLQTLRAYVERLWDGALSDFERRLEDEQC